jgi:hypothetical protein
MPSPFPGMNPYLEQASVWQDFHHRFITAAAEALGSQVMPRYFVKIEEHLYIHEGAEDARTFGGRADVAVSEGVKTRATGGITALLEAPATVRIPTTIDFERTAYLEIRDRDRRQLITVVELLSPSNKLKDRDREQYLAKREQILASSTNFVEIDLLRGGPRLPWENMQVCDYYVVVSRAAQRPDAGYWPLRLRDSLPPVPIPLSRSEPSAMLDLKTLLDHIYDSAGYGYYVYLTEPEPPLSAEDIAWARQLLSEIK